VLALVLGSVSFGASSSESSKRAARPAPLRAALEARSRRRCLPPACWPAASSPIRLATRDGLRSRSCGRCWPLGRRR
jgi:hypothetical protein